MRIFLTTGLLTGMFAVSVQAQEPVRVSVDPVCRDCSISVEHVATLGRNEDLVLPTWWSSVAVDREGNLYVGRTHSPGEIAVYSPTGGLLRTLGRQGEGPGEFKGIWAVRITGGDTLHVFSEGRHTVMSTGGEVYETSPFLVNGPEVFVLGDGRVLASDVIRTPDRVGLPAHILGPNGRPSLSFGNDSESPQGYQFGGSYRRVSLSGGDKIWVAPVGDYRLELWDSAGVHLRTLVREAPWFHPWLRDTPGQPFRERPNTKILSVHQDHRGMVWVFARIPDHNWQPNVEYPAYEHVYDVIVEVIDLSSGELITSQRFEAPEHFFFGFFSEGLVSSSSVNELGVEQIHIWRMRLHRPGLKGEAP